MGKKLLQFAKALLIIALPIMLQQLFLNIASLLDTMMVGQLDEASVSGVYVANQIIFVVNLMIFGATEGGSVFFCQFFGSRDEKNMAHCFAFKIYLSAIVGLAAMIICLVFAEPLSRIFVADADAVQISAKYLRILSVSYIPYAITAAISTCLRESHHATFPMLVTLAGAFLNFVINYVFIFGKLGAPGLGAVGAAIGTVTERVFEMIALIINLIVCRYSFTQNIKHGFLIDSSLFKKLFVRSVPLFFNEVLCAVGETVIVYIFTQNDAIATVSLPIAKTVYNLIFVVVTGLSQSVTILVGNTLGEGKKEEAQSRAYMSVFLAFAVGIVLCGLLTLIAPGVASLYKGVGEEGRQMGKYLIYVYAVYIILCSVNATLFFTLRSGGRTVIVFLFDSVYGWVIQIPFSFLLLYTTKLSFLPFVICCYGIDIVKAIVGLALIISKRWMKTLTLDEKQLKTEPNE